MDDARVLFDVIDKPVNVLRGIVIDVPRGIGNSSRTPHGTHTTIRQVVKHTRLIHPHVLLLFRNGEKLLNLCRVIDFFNLVGDDPLDGIVHGLTNEVFMEELRHVGDIIGNHDTALIYEGAVLRLHDAILRDVFLSGSEPNIKPLICLGILGINVLQCLELFQFLRTIRTTRLGDAILYRTDEWM